MYDVIILSGGFDPVHKGHVRMIKAASEVCIILIVGVNSDEWLRRKKAGGLRRTVEGGEEISSGRLNQGDFLLSGSESKSNSRLVCCAQP